MALAFAAAVAAFLAMLRPGAPDAVDAPLFSWLAAGRVQVEAALRLDALSIVMALIVTGVSLPIHIFSIGYVRSATARRATSRTSTSSSP